MRITETHVYFWGGPLSQWYLRAMRYKGVFFRSAEHYMMYHKALLFNDEATAKLILGSPHPKRAQELGKLIKPFDQVKWDRSKEDIVYVGNMFKFTQHEDLRILLTKTYAGKKFVEASPKDKIWGIGLHFDDDSVLDESKWKGQNLLGKVLNEVQSSLSST